MTQDTQELLNERLTRYVTAMNNEMPDKIPVRPFVAEFVARYTDYSCQDVTHDYRKAFEATRQCAHDFDWDATVPNMVYVWTGLTEAVGLDYYAAPGIDIEPDVAFQYREPPEEEAYMKSDEYDRLIDDPTAFLYDVWFPRVAEDIRAPGEENTLRNNVALVRSAMAMQRYFGDLGSAAEQLASETATVPAIAGILKAPFDILADKFRGYYGLTMDMHTQPEKVLQAAEALAPHLLQVAMDSADPNGQVPIGFWMHRGCVPFIRPEQFESHYWPTLKPIIEELWDAGHQTLFYAEGDWDYHLESFLELPERSIVYHVDRGDLEKAHQTLGHKFCLSGGIPNFALSYRSADEVRDICMDVIEKVAGDGGYIADASAIMQLDTDPDNLRAMTETFREHGVYSSGSLDGKKPEIKTDSASGDENHMADLRTPGTKPGVCVPWEEKRKELPGIPGNEELLQNIWEEMEAGPYTFMWHWVASF